MVWIKRDFYIETEDQKYQIWRCKSRWILEQAQPYYQYEMYIDDVYRVIGKFHTLKQAKIFAEWYNKKGE